MNYYALLVALVLVTALVMHGYREKNLKYMIVACLLLFAIYGLRNTYVIGGDTRNAYIGIFERMHSRNITEAIDYSKGKNTLFYIFTSAFARYISFDYQVYISCIAAFVTLCFGRLVYRFSPNPLQSILYHFGLLFFTFHFSALKQSIAMAILMLAFDQIVDKKPIRFLLLVLIAGQFHFPSLVFLPAYWIAKVHLGKAYLIVLLILLVVTYIFRSRILSFMLTLYHEDESSLDVTDIRFLRTKALVMIVIVAAAVVFRVPTHDDNVYETLLKFMGLAIMLQTFCGYDNTFERLADYYFQFSVVFLPMVFDHKAERKSLLNWRTLEVADTCAPFVFCGYSIYRFLTVASNDPTLSPFRFFFQKYG